MQCILPTADRQEMCPIHVLLTVEFTFCCSPCNSQLFIHFLSPHFLCFPLICSFSLLSPWCFFFPFTLHLVSFHSYSSPLLSPVLALSPHLLRVCRWAYTSLPGVIYAAEANECGLQHAAVFSFISALCT